MVPAQGGLLRNFLTQFHGWQLHPGALRPKPPAPASAHILTSALLPWLAKELSPRSLVCCDPTLGRCSSSQSRSTQYHHPLFRPSSEQMTLHQLSPCHLPDLTSAYLLATPKSGPIGLLAGCTCMLGLLCPRTMAHAVLTPCNPPLLNMYMSVPVPGPRAPPRVGEASLPPVYSSTLPTHTSTASPSLPDSPCTVHPQQDNVQPDMYFCISMSSPQG